VPLGVDLEGVGPVVIQPRERIEVEGPGLARMKAAQVDNQTAVDEAPDVVIAGEREDLARARS
jgi:hypothetical protein